MNNFQSLPITKQIEVNGTMMVVPLVTRYITIDELGFVEAWRHAPVKYKNHVGYVGNAGTNESPTSIGKFSAEGRIEPSMVKLPAGA